MMIVRELFLVLVSVGILVAGDGDCQTPNGQDGNCKPINDCRSLSSLLETSLPEKGSFLRKHHCGYLRQVPKVCCPLSDNLISPDTCGRDIARKIVGGQKTELDEFPWTAILEYERKSNGKTYFDCGGVLISSRYVLTAAHCIKTNLVRVRLGEYDTKAEIDCTTTSLGTECAPKPITIPIEEKISHESYNSDDLNQYNDIAILRLKENVTFTDFIKPICLPNKNEDLIGKNLHVAGWGITENGSASDVKLKVQIPVKVKSECESTFRSFNYNLTLTASQLCVGGEKGKDSCKGDSGGPLMTVRVDKNRDPQWYSEGIVSFGATPCGMRNWPGIYTKTAEYIPWIMSKMRT